MKVDQSREGTIVGIAWYKPTQWKRLLEVSEDADDLEGTFLEWSDTASDMMRRLRRAGLRVQRVDVGVEELLEWCRGQNLPVNATSRSRYTAQKLREEYL